MGSGVIKHKLRKCGEDSHGMAAVAGGDRDPRLVKDKKEGGRRRSGQGGTMVKKKK